MLSNTLLNIAVAERIFGATWRRFGDESAVFDVLAIGEITEAYQSIALCRRIDGEIIKWKGPDYSGNMTDAWRVVKAMRKKECDFYLRYVETPMATFDGELFGEAVHTKPPVAICLAALDAAGFPFEGEV